MIIEVRCVIYGKELSPAIIAKLHEAGVKLIVEKSGVFIAYRREGGFPEDRVEKIIESTKSCRIMAYPIHSIQMEVSTHLLLRLTKPIVVAPRSKLTVYATAPISVGIYVVEGNSRKLIDSFGFSPYKYALYGKPASGIVCRFYRTEVFAEPPEPALWEAVTKVRVENSTKEFIEVKNIVYPLLHTDLYVDDEGNAYMELAHLHIRGKGLGTVTLENEPPLSGLKRCPQPFMKLLEKVGKFSMEYGL